MLLSVAGFLATGEFVVVVEVFVRGLRAVVFGSACETLPIVFCARRVLVLMAEASGGVFPAAGLVLAAAFFRVDAGFAAV